MKRKKKKLCEELLCSSCCRKPIFWPLAWPQLLNLTRKMSLFEFHYWNSSLFFSSSSIQSQTLAQLHNFSNFICMGLFFCFQQCAHSGAYMCINKICTGKKCVWTTHKREKSNETNSRKRNVNVLKEKKTKKYATIKYHCGWFSLPEKN